MKLLRSLLSRPLILACITPLLFVIVAYIPAYTAPFMSDDSAFLLEWPLLHDLNNYPEILRGALPPAHAGGYRPLRTLFEAISYQMFAEHAALYHVQAVLIHMGNTLLVFFILKDLLTIFSHNSKRNISIPFLASFGSMVFGLHPLLSEGVVFIQASFDTIGISIAFASFFLFLKSISSTSKKGYVPMMGSVVLALLAFLFYELTYTLPLIFLVTGYLVWKQEEKISIRKIASGNIAAFLFLSGLLFLRFALLHVPSRVLTSPGEWFTFLAMTRAVASYFGQTFFPLNLYHIHELAPAITTVVSDPEFYTRLRITDSMTIAGIAAFSGTVVLAYVLKKRYPLLSLGTSWFVIGLLPVLNIIPSGSIYAERYTYFSLVGFSIVVTVMTSKVLGWISHYQSRKAVFLACYCIIACTYGIRTFLRALDWTNPIHFWSKEVQHLPKIGSIRNFLAVEYARTGNIQAAIEEFTLSSKLQPFDPTPFYNLSNLYMTEGKLKEARDYGEQALILKPADDLYLTSIIRINDAINDHAHSAQFYSSLINSGNELPLLYYLLGNASLRTGQTATAEAALRNAIKHNPQYVDAYNNLGALLNSLHRPQEAREILEEAQIRNLENSNLLYNLAVSYKMLGDMQLARQTIEEAKINNPFDKAVLQLAAELDNETASSSAKQ